MTTAAGLRRVRRSAPRWGERPPGLRDSEPQPGRWPLAAGCPAASGNGSAASCLISPVSRPVQGWPIAASPARLAWLFGKPYGPGPPRRVTRRCRPGGISPGGDQSPEGATGPAGARRALRTCRGHLHARQLHRRAVLEGLAGDSEHAGRIHRTAYRITVRHLIDLIGNVKPVELKVRDVDFALGKVAKRLSTRSVRLARMILIQAIRNAMVNDLVVRNVADLAAVPTGKPGRPSRSLNLEQALAVLDAAKGERLWPYVAVSMLGGIRTEEARALRWSEVDLEAGTVAVYRSVRGTGETKTERSRRVFQIPEIAVDALRDLVLKQAAARARAGAAWKENDLVFCTSLGGPMYATDVRIEFKRITEKAGLGRDWTPRELRHTFVS